MFKRLASIGTALLINLVAGVVLGLGIWYLKGTMESGSFVDQMRAYLVGIIVGGIICLLVLVTFQGTKDE